MHYVHKTLVFVLLLKYLISYLILCKHDKNYSSVRGRPLTPLFAEDKSGCLSDNERNGAISKFTGKTVASSNFQRNDTTSSF